MFAATSVSRGLLIGLLQGVSAGRLGDGPTDNHTTMQQ